VMVDLKINTGERKSNDLFFDRHKKEKETDQGSPSVPCLLWLVSRRDYKKEGFDMTQRPFLALSAPGKLNEVEVGGLMVRRQASLTRSKLEVPWDQAWLMMVVGFGIEWFAVLV
jgi:hypothetical protein